jgi:raffinose/stachyose/melibiose transport system permease protein
MAAIKTDIPPSFRVAAYATLGFFTVFTMFPLVWLGYTSLKPEQEIVQDIIAWPQTWTFDNYVQAWTLGEFSHLLVNSILYSGVTTLVVVLLAVSAAFAFTKIPSRHTPL